MSKRRFTKEQIADLLKNSNVAKCSEKSITYSREFKIKSVKLYRDDGLPARQIFTDAGFNMGTIGDNVPKDRLSAWKKIFRSRGPGGLAIERRGKSSNGGRPRTEGLSDAQKIKKLEATVAYLKAENDFLAKLRSGKTE